MARVSPQTHFLYLKMVKKNNVQDLYFTLWAQHNVIYCVLIFTIGPNGITAYAFMLQSKIHLQMRAEQENNRMGAKYIISRAKLREKSDKASHCAEREHCFGRAPVSFSFRANRNLIKANKNKRERYFFTLIYYKIKSSSLLRCLVQKSVRYLTVFFILISNYRTFPVTCLMHF